MPAHNSPKSAHNQQNPSDESFSPDTIVRIQRHERNYLTVANATVQDARLSFETLGLLIYLLSLPANWVIRVRHLQTRGGKWDEEKGENQGTGRDSVRRMLRELQTFGYLSGVGRDNQERGERGRFGQNEITVYEAPSLNPFHAEQSSPSPENPSTVAQPSAVPPSPDSPSPENPSTYKEQNPQKTERTNHTHTKTSLRAVGAPAEGVCVDGSICLEAFERYARNTPEIRDPEGWAGVHVKSGQWDTQVRRWCERNGIDPSTGAPVKTSADGDAARSLRKRAAGEFACSLCRDVGLLTRFNFERKEDETVNCSCSSGDRLRSERNVSACPDCDSAGLYYPDPANPQKGVAKCRHPRLSSVSAA
jgi:hypothetical protein